MGVDALKAALMVDGSIQPSIAILCPSRGRPALFHEMIESARVTAKEPFEVLSYLDEDDPSVVHYLKIPGVSFTVGPRILLGPAYEVLRKKTPADLVMMGADDLRFRTKHWDEAVRLATPPNLNCVISFEDGATQGKEDGHPFIGMTFIEALGGITHPEIGHCCIDNWTCGIAKKAGVFQRLPILIEHMHPKYDKGAIDQTYMENTLEQKRKDGLIYRASRAKMDAVAQRVKRCM